jgi:hypothetical protein
MRIKCQSIIKAQWKDAIRDYQQWSRIVEISGDL